MEDGSPKEEQEWCDSRYDDRGKKGQNSVEELKRAERSREDDG